LARSEHHVIDFVNNSPLAREIAHGALREGYETDCISGLAIAPVSAM
jgi:hypothetical protein